jgi:hypothetical protein
MAPSTSSGKITKRDETVARAWKWIPWFAFLLTAAPLPIVCFILFLGTVTTEAAALYLFLALVSGAIGIAAGLVLTLLLLFYRSRWMRRLREGLAADGITASEISWFKAELTTAERKALEQLRSNSPLLADAYRETLAARLMASRIIGRSRRDLLAVERRINRVALLQGADTNTLLKELQDDRSNLEETRREASARLTEAQARLQMIEAAASRNLNHDENYQMLQRLSAAQTHLPLSIEMDQIERRALDEAQQEVRDRIISNE